MQAFGAWLLKVILDWLSAKVIILAKWFIDKFQSEKTTEQNSKELKDALSKEVADDAEIRDKSEDLLNGNRN